MRHLSVLLLLFISATLMAQEPIKGEEKKKKRHITLQFGVNYTKINDLEGGEYQGRALLYLRPGFAVGIGAGGYFSSKAYDDFMKENYMVEVGYGGLVLEPVLFKKRFVYVSFPVLVGAGQVSYVRQDESWKPEGSYFVANDGCLVFIPAIEVNLAISSYVHLSLVGQYRFSSNVDVNFQGYQLVPKDVGNGWSVGLGLKFGRFKE